MASEALGKNPNEIIVEPKHLPRGYDVIRRMTKGERWCGEFPVRNKRGETFDVLANGTSLVDENGTLIGGVIVSTDTRPYQRTRPTPSVNAPRRIDSAKLALDAQQPLQTTIASRISNLASKVKAKLKTGDKLMDDEDNEDVHSSSKMDLQIHSFHDKILWEDLTMGQQIGQGSCGTVYHAMWYGSDVAVKVFSKQEFSIDVILPFRQEVSLMKRLRHPNILLFMGAVTSPQRLSIVTEFLPRGSLFRLIQRNTTRFDWRRRVHIAIDIARGMNYLHLCQPPIIHRDLKSSNLLVDKNWTVKVGDFGLSRIKNETYLTTKTGKGTPQWMAPEILRNEQANENYGVVLWEITTEKIPWESLNSMQVIGAVGFMNQQLDIPKDVDLQWASLLESCLCSEPKSRPTFYEILDELKILQKKFAAQLQASRTIAKGDNRQKAS